MDSQRNPPDFLGVDDSNEQARSIPPLHLGGSKVSWEQRPLYRVAVLQPRDRLMCVCDLSGLKTTILPKLHRQKDPKIR